MKNNTLILNPENASQNEISSYGIREAARAVVFDKNHHIALLHVTRKKYYKLPGGGIEPGENKIGALKRECREEIGCDISEVKKLGKVTEHRKIFKLNQISYCYTAKVHGDKQEPQFTNEEIADGFQVVWVQFEKALELIANSKVTETEGKAYIVPRDAAILKMAQKNAALSQAAS